MITGVLLAAGAGRRFGGPKLLRLVTHLDVSRDECERAASIVSALPM